MKEERISETRVQTGKRSLFSPSSENSFARASLTGDTTKRVYERPTAETSVKYSQKSSPIKNAILDKDPLSILEEEKSVADSKYSSFTNS